MMTTIQTNQLAQAIGHSASIAEAASRETALSSLFGSMAQPVLAASPSGHETLAMRQSQRASQLTLQNLSSALGILSRSWLTPSNARKIQGPLALAQLNDGAFGLCLNNNYQNSLRTLEMSQNISPIDATVDLFKTGFEAVKTLTIDRMDSFGFTTQTTQLQALQIPNPGQGTWASLQSALKPYQQTHRWNQNNQQSYSQHDSARAQREPRSSVLGPLARGTKHLLNSLAALFRRN